MPVAEPPLPENVRKARRVAHRLEWWTLAALVSVAVAVWLTMGGSQVMRAAFVEALISMLPPLVFLITNRLDDRGTSEKYPYGFFRANTLAFFASACALAVLGGLLIAESVLTLVRQHHPTIGSVRLFGMEVWLGWLMIAALAYSMVPTMLLGRRKESCAETLHDEVLHTDAKMNTADWKSGAAGIVGITGVAFGYWWADAVAAALIGLNILSDGVRAIAIATAELLDGAPRKLGTRQIDPAARRVIERLEREYGDVHVQTRQTGRFIRAAVETRGDPHLPEDRARELAGPEEAWRLIEVTVAEHGEVTDRLAARRRRQLDRPDQGKA